MKYFLSHSFLETEILLRIKYHKISSPFSLSTKQANKQTHLLPFVDGEEPLRQLGVEYLPSSLHTITFTYLQCGKN